MLALNNKRGMIYQTNEKHLTIQTNKKQLTIFPEYFIGVVKLAIYCYNNHFLFRVFTKNLLKYL